MKTAICFYGQPRFAKLCFEKYYSKIINHYNPDIFIHTWFDESKIGTHYPTGGTVNGTIEAHELLIREDTISELIDIYNPKKIKYEWYDEETSKKEFSSVLFQYYTQKSVKDIKVEYEKETGIVYDLIIRTRFDCVSSNFYDKVKESHLNVPDTCPNSSVYTDTISISNGEIFDKISDAYLSILENEDLKNILRHKPHGEYPLKHQIDKHNINVHRMPISSDVVRSHRRILDCIDF